MSDLSRASRPSAPRRDFVSVRGPVGRGGLRSVCAALLLGLAGCSEAGPGQPAEGDWQPQLPEFQRIAERLTGGENAILGTAQIETLRREIAQSQQQPQDLVAWRVMLSSELLRCGFVEEATVEIDRAFATMARYPGVTEANPDFVRLRGVIYLRQAEVQNCILRHNAQCCIFPLAGGGVHTEREPAAKARESFAYYLSLRPDDSSVRWLLNVVSMALGDYPHGVPPPYAIPPEVFESEYDIGRFRDIAGDLGLDTFNLCGGCIVDDFDNDGFLDIVTSTFDPDGPMAFYRNLGTGRFADESASSRLNDQLGGLNCIGADYDNDGDVDVLVLRGAWLFDDGQIRNSLLRNNGDGTFTDVTRAAGLATPAYPTQTAAWGDFDNDGDLDLYVGNESRRDGTVRGYWGEMPTNRADYPSQLFRNNGDGTFTDIAAEAGVANDRYAKGVAVGDYDNDGDLDLYVSNIGTNRLYRNNGDGTFTDVAPELGVIRPAKRSFATWFFDYNDDGWLDLFVVAYDATIDDVAAGYLGLAHQATAPCLYRNDGGRGTPGFTDVTREAGLDHPYLPMGANFGDLDNDGRLDIYLATGEPDYRALMPNIVLRNDRGLRFQDVTTSAGLGHLQKGHGVAFADIDNDGDQDIYHQLGGFYPGDKFRNALFENPGHDHHFLVVKLVGVSSNRAGFGVRIRLLLETPDGPREVHRAVGSVSSFGGSPRRQEIGLGDATRIRSLEISWPRSGVRQEFSNVPMDTLIQVTEGEAGFEKLPLRRVDL